MERLTKDVSERPDDYQHERAARFGVSMAAIWQGLVKLAMTHKKRLRHPKADAVLRQEFQTRVAEYEVDGKPVVYLDD